MDGICVQGDVQNVDSDSSHVLVAQDGFLGGPLEGTFHGVLDFDDVLHSLGSIDQ